MLCRRILGNRQYVWIDGGQVKNSNEFWERVALELNLPSETEKTQESATQGGLEASIPMVIDDFHYIPGESRPELMRNVKGAVFNGLKVILLSVSHRVFGPLKPSLN